MGEDTILNFHPSNFIFQLRLDFLYGGQAALQLLGQDLPDFGLPVGSADGFPGNSAIDFVDFPCDLPKQHLQNQKLGLNYFQKNQAAT